MPHILQDIIKNNDIIIRIYCPILPIKFLSLFKQILISHYNKYHNFSYWHFFIIFSTNSLITLLLVSFYLLRYCYKLDIYLVSVCTKFRLSKQSKPIKITNLYYSSIGSFNFSFDKFEYLANSNLTMSLNSFRFNDIS